MRGVYSLPCPDNADMEQQVNSPPPQGGDSGFEPRCRYDAVRLAVARRYGSGRTTPSERWG